MSKVAAEQWEARLTAAGVGLSRPTRASSPTGQRSPWAIRLLAGIGGFVGGVLLLVVVALGLGASRVFDTSESMTWIGLALSVGAVLIYRAGVGIIAVEQVGLAISLAGQMALGFGMSRLFHGDLPLQHWPQLLVQALMVLLVSNGLHRTLLAAAMVILGSLSCGGLEAAAIWWGVVALGLVALMREESRLMARGVFELVSPLVFGALAGLMVMQWPSEFTRWFGHSRDDVLPWYGAAALPAWLWAVWLASTEATPAQRAGVVLLALAVGVLGIWLPGWTVSLLLGVMGLAWARPGWAVIAVIAMIGSISHFYYTLRITLLEKAAWMAAAGLACLALAALVYGIAPRLAPIRNPGGTT